MTRRKAARDAYKGKITIVCMCTAYVRQCKCATGNNTSSSGSMRCTSRSQAVTCVVQLWSRCPTRSKSTHLTQVGRQLTH